MADNRDDQPRPTKRDPRLLPVASEAMTTIAFYGRMAGWAGSILLLVTLFMLGILRSFHPIPVKVVGILALVCIAFWVYTNIQQLIMAVRTRGVQTALNSTLFSIFVLAILVAINYLGLRHEVFRADLTKNKQFSLSPQTIKILKALDKKVTIVAFVSPENDKLRRLLREYDLKGDAKVDLQYYDPRTDVDKVQEYGVRSDPTLYLETQGQGGEKRKEEIVGGTEEQITSTILSVTTGQKTRICFLTGHGEASLEMSSDPSKPSVSNLKSALEKQQYKVDPLTLMTEKNPQVPSDCKLLVIAGARLAPGPAEMKAITQYVDQGGNLMLMIEPPPAPNFADLLKAHGITPLAGMIRDPQGSISGRDTILVAKASHSHDVTAPLDIVGLPTATGFDIQSTPPPPSMPGAPPPPQENKAVPLLTTYSSQAQVIGGPARTGEFNLAVAVDESPKPPPEMPGQPPQPTPPSERRARLIAIGDVDFISDSFLQQLSDPRQNFAFAAIAVNWLVKNEKLVSIPPHEPVEKPFNVTDSQKRFAWALTVGIIPLLIIFGGVFAWWRRRV